MRGRVFIALAIGVMFVPLPARAQTIDDPYNIMKPEPGTRQPKPLEPWLAPKYKSPRSSHDPDGVLRQREATPPLRANVPPPLYVPQTGQLLPNLPSVPGAGPGGTETGQDRAVRCAHHAGVYGAAAGNPSAYVGSCINQ